MSAAEDFLALLDCLPTPGAHAAEVLTADEIDALPCADRVWATVLAARELIFDLMEG